jgi:cell division protein FtsW (lipid II flippase)
MPPEKTKSKTGNLIFLALSILGVLTSLLLSYVDPDEFPHVISTDFFIFLFVSILSALTLLEPRIKGRPQTLSGIVQMLLITALVLVALYHESSKVRSWIAHITAQPQPLETAIGTGAILLLGFGFVRIENRFPTTCAFLETFAILLVVGYGVLSVVSKPGADAYVGLVGAALALVVVLRHVVDKRKPH